MEFRLAWVDELRRLRSVVDRRIVHGDPLTAQPLALAAVDSSERRMFDLTRALLEQPETRMFYMNAVFQKLVAETSVGLPKDLAFDPVWLQHDDGFCYLEEPVAGDPGDYRAFSWQRVDVMPQGTPAFAIAFYTEQTPTKDFFKVMPMVEPGETIGGLTDETGYAVEFGWVYAALYLMGQRLATTIRRQPDRGTRRRAEHAGHRLPPFIDVVTLRRLEADRVADPRGRDIDWQWQWWVSPHWRRQWYPSDGVNRWKLIPTYLKGPSGRPLKPGVPRFFVAKR